jgi:hypothetical protein
MSDPHGAHHTHGGQDPHTGHETTDVHVRPIVIFGVGLVVTIVLVIGITYGMLQVLLWRSGETAASRPEFTIRGRSVQPPVTAGPPYQPDPVREMKEFRAREDALLGSYGWVDRDAERVRLPIGRAMEILVQRGAGPLRAEPKR